MVTFTQPLLTERLLLRPLVATDLEAIHAYQRLPEVTQFMFWPVRTLDESREHLERRMLLTTLQNDEDVLVVAAVLGPGHPGAGRLIGEITVFLHSVENRQAEVGWAFHPDYQGQGYAREAASRMLDYAFAELDAHRVSAELDPRNTSSSGLALRLGMRLEAHLRENLFFKGEWGDTAIYGILRSEWARSNHDPLAAGAGVDHPAVPVGAVPVGAVPVDAVPVSPLRVAAGPLDAVPVSPLRVAALALVRERRLLMVTARQRDVLYLPGGKIDAGETALEAVRRECREEIDVELDPASIRYLFTVTTQAHGESQGRMVQMNVFGAETTDEPRASAEVDSLHWVTSADRHRCPPAGVETIDRLVALGLID